jgi:hypothetical protein
MLPLQTQSRRLLRFAKQPGGDVAHVGFLELVVLATHLINPDVFKRGDDVLDVEAHGDKAVDELLVVAVVSTSVSQYSCKGSSKHTPLA